MYAVFPLGQHYPQALRLREPDGINTQQGSFRERVGAALGNSGLDFR